MPIQGPYSVDWVYEPKATNHVLGIGDVELEVRAGATTEEQGYPDGQSYHTLILRDVLYIPKAETNIVAVNCLPDIELTSAWENPWIRDKRGRVFLLDKPPMLWYKLWLVGQRRGQSCLKRGQEYDIGVNWSEGQRKKWELHKADSTGAEAQPGAAVHKRKPSGSTSDVPEEPQLKRPKPAKSKKYYFYSHEEKAWIKKHLNSEWEFLKDCNLTMDLPNDRERGRDIIRAAISMQNSKQLNQLQLGACIAEQRATYSGMEDLPSYTRFEHMWLMERYGGEFAFLKQKDFDRWNEKDVEEGREIARTLMREYGYVTKRGRIGCPL